MKRDIFLYSKTDNFPVGTQLYLSKLIDTKWMDVLMFRTKKRPGCTEEKNFLEKENVKSHYFSCTFFFDDLCWGWGELNPSWFELSWVDLRKQLSKRSDHEKRMGKIWGLAMHLSSSGHRFPMPHVGKKIHSEFIFLDIGEPQEFWTLLMVIWYLLKLRLTDWIYSKQSWQPTGKKF